MSGHVAYLIPMALWRIATLKGGAQHTTYLLINLLPVGGGVLFYFDRLKWGPLWKPDCVKV